MSSVETNLSRQKHPGSPLPEPELKLTLEQKKYIYNVYLTEVTRRHLLNQYKELRAHYELEVLNQATLLMATRVLSCAKIPTSQRVLFPRSFIPSLVQVFLMTELEVAILTYYLQVGKQGKESLEHLVLLCAYHAKNTMTRDIRPIQLYVESEYPSFSHMEYMTWVAERQRTAPAPKQMNRIFNELKKPSPEDAPGSYDLYIDNVLDGLSKPISPQIVLNRTQNKETQTEKRIEALEFQQLDRVNSTVDRSMLQQGLARLEELSTIQDGDTRDATANHEMDMLLLRGDSISMEEGLSRESSMAGLLK